MRRRAWAAAGLAALLAAEAAVAYGVPAVARWEGRVPRWLPHALTSPGATDVAREVTSLGDPLRFALLGAVAVGLSLWRLGPTGAVRTAVVLAGATVTTQVLQELLSAPRDFGFGPRTLAFPSGHMTGATALGLAAAAAVRSRPAAVVGLVALVDAAMAWALLATGSHVPSDLLAGVLVAGAWGAAVGQSGRRSSREARKPSRARVARNHQRET